MNALINSPSLAIRMVFLAIMATLVPANAHAHKPSDSYLSLALNDRTVSGRWDIALRDLDFVLQLDANGDGKLTWGEVRARATVIEQYAMEHLAVAVDGADCRLGTHDLLIDTHTDGAYVVLDLDGSCPSASRDVSVRYQFLQGIDATHRGLLKLEANGVTQSAVLTPGAAVHRFPVAHASRWHMLMSYLADGVHHIWTGYDHLLFLCSLLLPSVAMRRGGRWVPAARWQWVASDVLRTVTAFTIAHSLTLALSVWGVVSLPSRLVESVIALTVVLAALNNLYPLVESRRWLVAFIFGLIHGFGFASVLAGLDLPSALDRAVALLGFNAGVEAGQVTVVAILLPLLYAIRSTVFYRRAVLFGGSCTVAIIAMAWLLERALDMRLLPAG